jgi:hypothetical protein
MTEIRKLTDEFRRNVRAMARKAVEGNRTNDPMDAAKVRIVRARLDKELLGAQARMDRSFGRSPAIDQEASSTDDHEAQSPGQGDRP